MSSHRRRRSPSVESSDSRSRSPHHKGSPVLRKSRKSPVQSSSNKKEKDVGETFAELARYEIDHELASALATEQEQQSEKDLEVSLGDALPLNQAKNLFLRCKYIYFYFISHFELCQFYSSV